MSRDRKYMRKEPVSTVKEALELLCARDRLDPVLWTNERWPYIDQRICNGGYTHDCYNGSEYYKITQKISRELIESQFVRGTKYWGYTDDQELRITDRGYEELRRLKKEGADNQGNLPKS